MKGKKKNTEEEYFFPTKISYQKLLHFKDQILYIPKEDNNNKTIFIPCCLIKSKENSPNFMIMYHGNGEIILDYIDLGLEFNSKFNMNILIIEYKGYSCYLGEVDSDSILEDSLFIYDYIKKLFNIQDNNIYVFGRSMGTAPAVYLSSKRNPKSTILVSAFESIKNIGKVFKEDEFEDIFKSIDSIQQVKNPILIIHGKKDPLILYKNSENLYEKCSSQKKKLVLRENMTHNYFDYESDILEQIELFFKEKKIEIDDRKNVIHFDDEKIKQLLEIPSELKSLDNF